MDVQVLSQSSRFADRIAKMLERVEHLPVVSRADREAAYRLRYEAYLRENRVNPQVDAMLCDDYDKNPNSLTTMTYIDGELASTLRVHVITEEVAVSPTCDVFQDMLASHRRRLCLIVDSSRLAARAEMARRFPELPYFATRPGWMAAHHFNADYMVLSCSSAHQAYYRRVLRFETWSDLRSYPKVTFKVVCMGLNFAAEMERVEARYPSFRSTPAEREALFGELSSSLAPVATLVGTKPADLDVRHANP
jgi:hypothetical protein